MDNKQYNVCYIDCDGFTGIYICQSLSNCFLQICAVYYMSITHIHRERQGKSMCVCVCVCVCACVRVYERKTEPQRGRRIKGGEVREGKRK